MHYCNCLSQSAIAQALHPRFICGPACLHARRLLVMEFSQVTQPGLRDLYDAYSFAVIPRLGALVANDADSYQYLVESIRKFPDQVGLTPRHAHADPCNGSGFAVWVICWPCRLHGVSSVLLLRVMMAVCER